MELLHAPIERADPSDIALTELQALGGSINTFAFDLYHQFRRDAGNLAFSPYSLYTALSMTLAGARGRTQQQMSSALYYTLSQAQTHPVVNALSLWISGCEARANRATSDMQRLAADNSLWARFFRRRDKKSESEGLRLAVANALWVDARFDILPEYLEVLAKHYGAGVRTADFSSDRSAERARVAINAWVSDQTSGKITNLMRQIPPAMTLVLLNALYFRARWEHEFDPDSTRPCPYTLMRGGQIYVPMMSQFITISYDRGDHYQIVECPYLGGDLSMVILMPDLDHFERFERTLFADRVRLIVDALTPRDIVLTLPKFACRSELCANDALQQLGVSDAFSVSKADFSGMSDFKPLFVDTVLHSAFVDVNEQGTEAAAATAIAVVLGGPSLPPIQLIIDRPFIYLIRDRRTGAILFLGRVLDPSRET